MARALPRTMERLRFCVGRTTPPSQSHQSPERTVIRYRSRDMSEKFPALFMNATGRLSVGQLGDLRAPVMPRIPWRFRYVDRLVGSGAGWHCRFLATSHR
jgi:hypothetical protein